MCLPVFLTLQGVPGTGTLRMVNLPTEVGNALGLISIYPRLVELVLILVLMSS